jgi:hypothetical protein
MATERQIAANRRNALHSKGPRSIGGKKRASRNSIRHGFDSTRTVPDAKRRRAGQSLARRFFGAEPFLENALNSAQAEFTLARIRQLKVILIKGLSAFSGLDAFQPVEWVPQVATYLAMFKEAKRRILNLQLLTPTAPAVARQTAGPAATLGCPLELNNLSHYE